MEFVIEHDKVHAFVETSGLAPIVNCSFYMVDKSILSAFAERWHRETSSFHPPFDEMIITLDDVSSLLCLPITGAHHRYVWSYLEISFFSGYLKWGQLMHHYLSERVLFQYRHVQGILRSPRLIIGRVTSSDDMDCRHMDFANHVVSLLVVAW